MRIGAILRRWIDVLATLLLAWHERQRERRAVTLAFEGRHLAVRDIRSGQAIPAGAAELKHAARDAFVVLECPADRLVTRQISVPAQAEKFLSGVVSNCLLYTSPSPRDGLLSRMPSSA